MKYYGKLKGDLLMFGIRIGLDWELCTILFQMTIQSMKIYRK